RHAAIVADGALADLARRRHCRLLALLAAAGEERRQQHRADHPCPPHSCLLAKQPVASDSGTTIQRTSAASSVGWPRCACSLSPAMPENMLTLAKPVRLSSR